MVALNEQVTASEGSVVPSVIEVTKTVADIVPVSEEDFETAQRNFQQGKKFLLLNKFDEAVSNFDEACKIFSKKYGEMDIECADVYFFYGKALLEVARVENTVLGNALNGMPDDSAAPVNDSRYGNPDEIGEKERESIAEQVVDAMCEDVDQKTTENVVVVEPQAAAAEPVAAVVSESAPVVVEESVVEPKPVVVVDTEVKPQSSVDGIVEKPAVVDGEDGIAEGEEEVDDEEEDGEEVEGDEAAAEGDDEDAEEDISNLQRAWEMFELAKLVYKNNATDVQPYKRRIAECLLKLGEISIEQELYEQAIVDITESIRLQEEETAAVRDERLLAETYYQLGLGQQFNNQFKLALDSYQRSISILQNRIDKLKQEVETIEVKQPVQDEIAELEAILPEILAKIEECNEQDKETLSLVKEAKEVFINKINGNGQQAAEVATSAEVKDITSLVKSKRKLEDQVDDNVKKTKFEGGNAEVEPPQNGDNTETAIVVDQQ